MFSCLFCFVIFVVNGLHKLLFSGGLFQFSFHDLCFFSFGLSSLFSIMFCHVPSHIPLCWFSCFPLFQTTFRRPKCQCTISRQISRCQFKPQILRHTLHRDTFLLMASCSRDTLQTCLPSIQEKRFQNTSLNTPFSGV